ncbi:hypothetical protein Tco_1001426, partial [Tanacetum coccineum]
ADPDLAKFRDKNLEMYHMYYEQLFCDSVAVGDKTRLPIQFQNNDSPSNNQEEYVGAENIEGNRDSEEFNNQEEDGVVISFPESSSTKKKKKDKNSNTRSKKAKTTVVTSFELKLDTVLQTLTSRSSQTFPPQNHVPCKT